MKKINIITLGCSKNIVDSEHIASQLAASGYELLFDSEDSSAKIVVINTCGFIGDAKQESIDMILSFAQARKSGHIDKLFVIGCLSERYADVLREEIPEVDSYFGARDMNEVVRALGIRPNEELSTSRILTTPTHYAYLKISEGCNWSCSYCAIPLIRGKHRSVPMEELVIEAEKLSGQGVKELIVIAQDTTFYGMDLYGKRSLAELLRRLCRVDGIEWIRLHYAYPTAFPEDVIDVMATETKICKYLDIPLQHISTPILKSMKRGIDTKGTYDLIDKLRARIEGIAIRTTLIVGYPNETEEDFRELKDFVTRCRFERLGVFTYSHEEQTWAGENLEDNIPEDVKQQRRDEIMVLQSDISAELNAMRLGARERVIVDREEGDFFVARSQYDSPEVDTEILISCEQDLCIGSMVDIKITSASEYDLTAEIE